MSDDRELRDLVERLQTDLNKARADGAHDHAEVARLTDELQGWRAHIKKLELELKDARKAAADADAAFEHVVKRLRTNEAAAKAIVAPQTIALANDGIPPSKLELNIRFGFGSILGMSIGAALSERVMSLGASWGIILGGGVAFGLLARHYGDRFWYGLVTRRKP